VRLAALFSGGKDSTFAIYAAKQMNHSIECLIVIGPESDESRLLHFPNIEFTKLQSESMQIPSLHFDANDTDSTHEIALMREMLRQAKNDFGVEGVVHGGILSEFQKSSFREACRELGLETIAPLWQTDQSRYMHKLVDEHFDFIITSVTADGLDDSWLGRVLTKDDLSDLEKLSKKHSFNVSFEGGEAETFVVDCPLFSKPIVIKDASKSWDGYRGRFEILEAELDNHA